MKAFQDIDLGYSDAINYKNNRRYKDLFSRVFVKDEKLDRLMREDTYYLIGDKGTGKTAYSVFLENNEYNNTQTKVIDLDSTDYKIFMNLKRLGFIQLSDFTRIWKIILLVIVCESIQKKTFPHLDLAVPNYLKSCVKKLIVTIKTHTFLKSQIL